MRFILITLLMFAAVASVGQSASPGSAMTHEEEVVRTTYAKLSFADEVRIILDTLNGKSPMNN